MGRLTHTCAGENCRDWLQSISQMELFDACWVDIWNVANELCFSHIPIHDGMWLWGAYVEEEAAVDVEADTDGCAHGAYDSDSNSSEGFRQR